MLGKKILYPLLFVAITICLVRSRILLNLADSILMSIDRMCRASSIQCTGGDYDFALLITALAVNSVVALVFVVIIEKIVHAIRKTS
ncbi:hypothetical protein BIY26_18980 [Brenneria goodwinii]|uniref:Uncharacterized protein n=1 Tax=Brenneria goodwinii TaxID=1109412 RepID=A0AAE8JLN5_9GAMM|nr:hypothetical protein [Brenneria goodwinii]ATA22640.1 hypothetical protein AWC36_00085 [Brenneria goodwinii]RLM18344.1 hypothetical protein BIY26_18980 [Brenneria goodwinii]